MESRQNMLNYGLRIISTQDPKVQKACEDKNYKGRAVIKLMSEIWDIKQTTFSKLKEIFFSFKDIIRELKGRANKESLILHISEYLSDNTAVENQTWKQVEVWLVEQGFLTKGGIMDIREFIKEKGRWQGRQEGRQEGRKERSKEVILNMLKEKIDTSVISKVTGLSEKEIKKLKNGS